MSLSRKASGKAEVFNRWIYNTQSHKSQRLTCSFIPNQFTQVFLYYSLCTPKLGQIKCVSLQVQLLGLKRGRKKQTRVSKRFSFQLRGSVHCSGVPSPAVSYPRGLLPPSPTLSCLLILRSQQKKPNQKPNNWIHLVDCTVQGKLRY